MNRRSILAFLGLAPAAIPAAAMRMPDRPAVPNDQRAALGMDDLPPTELSYDGRNPWFANLRRDPNGRWPAVYLDGVEQPLATTASVNGGWLDRFSGVPGNYGPVERVYGKVEIRY